MVVTESCTAEGSPDLFSVGIVVIGNAFIGEFALESLLWWEGFLIKSGPAVHILVGVDTLAEQEGTPLGVRLEVCCVVHVSRVTGFHQAIQA